MAAEREETTVELSKIQNKIKNARRTIKNGIVLHSEGVATYGITAWLVAADHLSGQDFDMRDLKYIGILVGIGVFSQALGTYDLLKGHAELISAETASNLQIINQHNQQGPQ